MLLTLHQILLFSDNLIAKELFLFISSRLTRLLRHQETFPIEQTPRSVYDLLHIPVDGYQFIMFVILMFFSSQLTVLQRNYRREKSTVDT